MAENSCSERSSLIMVLFANNHEAGRKLSLLRAHAAGAKPRSITRYPN